MALSITSIARLQGAACDHVRVTGNVEGVTRSFVTSLTEIDELIDSLGPVEAQRQLVILWAAYRRKLARTVTGVDIA